MMLPTAIGGFIRTAVGSITAKKPSKPPTGGPRAVAWHPGAYPRL
jgi:hypothetical protein